ncbi:MAG: hypothetical protein HY689_10115 [Chloroflexi bacterium]|nr:hypothetical protein [Chloroflexota bacterium]
MKRGRTAVRPYRMLPVGFPVLDQFGLFLVVAAITLALLMVCGLAPLRLLPPALAPVALGLLPATGLAAFSVGAYWVSLALPMEVGAWALVAVGVGAGALAWWTSPPGPLPSEGRRGDALPSLPGTGVRWEGLAVMGLAALALVLALVPIVGRPELLAMGPNWDVEIYLPLAEALQRFPNGFSLEHPAGAPFPTQGDPLMWRLNFFDPRSGGLAFSLLHSSLGALTGLPAYRSFAPLLACLFALSVPGTWALLRGGFGLGRGPAVWATALLSLNSAVLYVVVLGFGQQVAALVLLPAALTVGMVALRSGEPRTAALAGLLLAGLIAAYTPALPLYGAVLAAVGIVGLAGNRRGHALRGGGMLLATAVAVYPLAAARLGVRLAAFLGEGGTRGLTEGPEVRAFAPLAWALGLLPGPGVGVGWSLPVALPWATPAVSLGLVAVLGGLALIGLAAAALDRTQFPALRVQGATGSGALLLGSGAAALLLGALRFVTPYPYGYFKLLPMAADLLIAPAALGLGWLAARRPPLPAPAQSSRYLAVLLGGGLLVVVGVTGATAAAAGRTQSVHTFGAAARLAEVVPAGASVCITGGPGLEGPPAAAALLFLRHAEPYGFLRTGYRTIFRPAPRGCDYGLAPAATRPDPELYAWDRPVWEGVGWRLAPREAGILAFRDFGHIAQPPVIARNPNPGSSGLRRVERWRPDGTPALEAALSPPLLGVLSVTAGPAVALPVIDREGVRLTVGSDDIALGDAGGSLAGSAPEQRTFAFTVIAFQPTRISFGPAGAMQTVPVPAGVTTLSHVRLDTPTALTVRSEGTVWLKSAAVRPVSAVPVVPPAPHPESVALQVDGDREGSVVRLDLHLAAGDLVPVLDIYRDDGGSHWGWWDLRGALAAGQGAVQLDLERKVATTRDGTPLHGQGWPTGDGLYRGYLALYRDSTPVRRLPLLAFRVIRGAVTEFALEQRGVVVQ